MFDAAPPHRPPPRSRRLDAIRWHLIERSPGAYDFSSVLSMLDAARRAGVQVIWDLLHYGWPDDIDIFAPEFVERFARLAAAFAEVAQAHTDGSM